MTDIFLPPWLNVARVGFSPVESVGVSQSPFGGFPRTALLSSGRMRASMEFTPAGGASTQMERRRLIALMAQGGKQNRWVLHDPSYRQAGSFPAQELLSNNTFANGTTGWTAGGQASISVTDRVMRITRTGGGFATPQMAQSVAAIPFVPYVVRAMMIQGLGSPSLVAQVDDGISIAANGAGPGLATASIVAPGSTLRAVPVDFASSGVAGEYFEIPYVSLSRCALVDGGVNVLTRSDEFNDASWSKVAATVTANSNTSPDGTVTADSIVDNATNTSHYVEKFFNVSAAAADFSATVAVAPASRNFLCIEMRTATGAASVFFNLATGAISTLGASVSFSNPRAFVKNIGGTYLQVCLVARKTTAETLMTVRIYSANNGSSTAYAGSGTAAVILWRGTLSTSGVPQRLKQTSGAVSSGESQLGNALYLKGLPPSASGLLLAGDVVEVIGARGGEMKIVTAPLHSDALGLGHLQFTPAMRFSPADNAAVIINQPMGRFIFDGEVPAWSTDPGLITTASAEFIEA